MAGRPPTATVLKLIRGETRPSRLRSDRPKLAELPRVPPGAVLSPDERAMWDYLMETVVVPGVHGAGDGASFVKICKLWARACEADARCAKHGLVMKGPTGRPEQQPYARVSEKMWHQLGIALSEVGATPSGRARIAGPRAQGQPGEPNSWDEID